LVGKFHALLKKRQRQRAFRVSVERVKRARRYYAELRQSPLQSAWYKMFVDDEIGKFFDPGNPKETSFISLFFLPRPMFKDLVQRARNENKFKAEGFDALGRQGSPLELLILGALAVLRGVMKHCALYCVTYISAQRHSAFFDEFTRVGSEWLYRLYVKFPTDAELALWARTYTRAALPGVVASMDGVHVLLLNCAHAKRMRCTGKDKVATLAFLVCADTTGRIWYASHAFAGATNDNSMLQKCPKLLQILNGARYNNYTWKMYEEGGNVVWKRGALILTDNGFAKYHRTVRPIANKKTVRKTPWSRWTESMRKDIERVFGILKQEFRMLREGFRSPCFTQNARIFRTCCALHNMRLERNNQTYGYWMYLGDVADEAPQENQEDDIAEVRLGIAGADVL
jgi:hypothetical protein